MKLIINSCFVIVLVSVFNKAIALETKTEKQLNINCLKQSEANAQMEKNKAEFYSGLSVTERYQKLHDGSLEKHFSKKFDEINSIKKEESNPDFFSGLTMQERFQKLYDGSFERHFSKLHDLRKKESYLQNSIGAASTSINCQNNFDGMNLEGKSVSDKLQMLRDGTLEKKVFGE